MKDWTLRKLRQLNDHNPRDEGKTNKHGTGGKQNINFWSLKNVVVSYSKYKQSALSTKI